MSFLLVPGAGGARERLGLEPAVVPGGHLAALSRPEELATALREVPGLGRPRH